MKTNGVVIPVTMSIGATASVDGKAKAADVDSIIHTADNALYKAKNNGRNRVEFSIYEESRL